MRLGFLEGYELGTPPRRSAMILAPTGAGKTPRFVVPVVLLHQGPAVVTSVKADVLYLTRDHRKTQGPVWVFDPSRTAGPTARWSPLAHIKTWADALDAAKWIQESSKVSGESSGITDATWWDNNARHLLAPLVYLAAQPHVQATMGTIAQWVATLNERSEKQIKDRLEQLAQAAPVEGAESALGPLGFWINYTSLKGKTKATISSTAFNILEGWAHPSVAAAVSVTAADTGDDVLDIDRLLDSGGTLYLVAPASDQDKFKAVFETLINAVVMNVEHRAHRNGGKPINPPLLLALDEAANIATPRRLDQIASKSANEGICLLSVWQDEGQIETIYGRSRARSVVANHFAKIYLPGIQDQQTLENLSRAIGSDLFAFTSTTSGRDSSSTSTSYHELPVAPTDQLRMLADDEAIVIVSNYPPIRARLRGWFEDDELRALVHPEIARAYDQTFAPVKATA